jgi:hypothetical protein
MSYPESWAADQRPRPHHLWVERDEKAVHTPSGLLILPASYRANVKLATGTVRKVGAQLTGEYVPGQRVILSQGVVKTIAFGELELSVVTAPQVLITLLDDTIEIETGEFRTAHRLYDETRSDIYRLLDAVADEGVSTRAPRSLAQQQ